MLFSFNSCPYAITILAIIGAAVAAAAAIVLFLVANNDDLSVNGTACASYCSSTYVSNRFHLNFPFDYYFLGINRLICPTICGIPSLSISFVL